MKRFLLGTIFFSFIRLHVGAQDSLFVSPSGNDLQKGTRAQPLKTLEAAIEKARNADAKDVVILLRKGQFELTGTVVIQAADCQFNSLQIMPYQKEKVTLTGAHSIKPAWQPYQHGVLRANIALDNPPDQLFINGVAAPMARYPNYDDRARIFHGTAADALSKERVSRWRQPAGGFIHALHAGEWGDLHFRILGKDSLNDLLYEGGWQNNRPAGMHGQHRFVENIWEELDAPGEWYYNQQQGMLYLYPPPTVDLRRADITISSLTDMLHLCGTAEKPLKNIIIRDLIFTQTARTFMLVREPLLRSDWAIYRGGAILLDGTENIRISNCVFKELGGNAVFVSNYSRRDTISDNHIYRIGGNAIAFVGDPAAVRSPSFSYEKNIPWQEMDFEKGPRSPAYPAYCVASGNLIHDIGTIEKQVAGVQLSMSAHISVAHNTIYQVPRAGINISEGAWGGHLIEYNDVFNTVLETGDHGAFNSWGRDRFWRPDRPVIDSIVASHPGIELLDAIDPITIRNNRFRCDHGWDIDLDDGSTNYRIYRNICLNGGLKLREGYHRIVYNNILINNTLHPHVWLNNSGDVFTKNIVATPYAPVRMEHWGSRIDSNFFLTKEALMMARDYGTDQHSRWGDAKFETAQQGNYQLSPVSPALATGFTNIDTTFGVTSPALKKLAQKPEITPLLANINQATGTKISWLGATLKNIETLGERSAAGLYNNNGAWVIKLPLPSLAAESGLQKGDVIIRLADQPILSTIDLLTVYQRVKWMGNAEALVVRNQQNVLLKVKFK